MPLATLDEVASLEGLAMTQATSEVLQAGQPVFVAGDGTLHLSSAAAGANRATVDGFARAATPIGQSAQVENHQITLADWTAVTGAAGLVPGTRYYLDATPGKLTATAPTAAGAAVIRVGVALSAQVLSIEIVAAAAGAGGESASQVAADIAAAFVSRGVPDGTTIPALIDATIAAQGTGQGVSSAQSIVNSLIFG